MKHFTYDRFKKYGLGVFRLLVVVLVSFCASNLPLCYNARNYLSSYRILGHAYIGTIGAAVNVDVVDFKTNLVMLVGAGIVCCFDLKYDYSILIYLMKTFGGDFFAGKLDTTEWKLVLLFVFGLFGPSAVYIRGTEDLVFWTKYTRIFAYLFFVQLICEYGDNHWEHLTFFRHRYSFEVANLVLVLFCNLDSFELDVVRYDIVICFFYRLSNFLIILLQTDYLVHAGNMLIFKVYGIYTGTRVIQVKDPELATLVMKNSTNKGLGLEKFMSAPAWLPGCSVREMISFRRNRPVTYSMHMCT